MLIFLVHYSTLHIGILHFAATWHAQTHAPVVDLPLPHHKLQAQAAEDEQLHGVLEDGKYAVGVQAVCQEPCLQVRGHVATYAHVRPSKSCDFLEIIQYSGNINISV